MTEREFNERMDDAKGLNNVYQALQEQIDVLREFVIEDTARSRHRHTPSSLRVPPGFDVITVPEKGKEDEEEPAPESTVTDTFGSASPASSEDTEGQEESPPEPEAVDQPVVPPSEPVDSGDPMGVAENTPPPEAGEEPLQPSDPATVEGNPEQPTSDFSLMEPTPPEAPPSASRTRNR